MEGVQSGLVDKKLIKLPFKEATENPGNLVISRLSGFFHLSFVAEKDAALKALRLN